jgi:GR25 family glycosyltransferase involved in LPS biosynthesis
MLDIYVINLIERTDRMDDIKNLFSNDFNIIGIDAIKNEIGWKGCFLSHLKCIQLAKDNNLKNIIVMEDDCIPFDNYDAFKTRLYNIKKYLDNNDDWNIFLGGTFTTKIFSIIRKIDYELENIYEINQGYCFHLVIYNNICYDYFLKAEIIKPIDNIWNEKFNALITLPFIANQKDNYSDISNNIQSNFSKKIRLTNKRLTTHFIKYENAFV